MMAPGMSSPPFSARLRDHLVRDPIARAEVMAAAWELFSGLLFVAVVVPAALDTVWPSVIFIASMFLSAALVRRFAKGRLRGLTAAAVLRTFLWVVAVTPMLAPASGGPATLARDYPILVAALVFGAMAGWMRWLIYRWWLEPSAEALDDKDLRARLRWLLTESSMMVGIAGGHVLLLFSVAFLRTQSQVIFQAWFELIPWLALLGTAGFALAVGPLTADIVAALDAGPSGEKSLLARGLAQAQSLPNKLASLNFGAWILCTSIGIVYFARPEDDVLAWGNTAMQILFGLLFAAGVSFYQLIWHRDTVGPAAERLRRWLSAQASAEPISLRTRMLREFGLPLLFICTLSLFSSIGLYRALVEGLSIREDFNAVMALVASFTMLLAAAGGLVVRAAVQLSRPMTELAQAANKVAQGKLDEVVPAVSGPVEIVGLGESIERMRARLARTIAELEKERAGLEANVEARTAELRKALDELRHAQAALVQGERLASIGELVSGVAHEIYNPLNAIAGASDPLSQIASDLRTMMAAYHAAEAELPEARRRAIEEIRRSIDLEASLEDLGGIATVVRRATDRSVKIVQNLKNFSRVSGEAVPSDLHAGIEETLMLLAPRLRQENIQVIKRYGELPLVTCRPGEMNQVFMNLLVNAIQAFEQEGAPAEPSILIETWREGDMAAVAVTDNGSGVPTNIARRIFDPFFTTKPKGQGTGLGLSISTDIARRHGGSLTLESPRDGGSGSRFVCVIPLGKREAPRSNPAL
jgi:signal transduction histidine kinase